MLAGRARITAIDPQGRNFIDDVGAGDLWNFPAGIPHSIQGLEEGCEFLLVFDNGNFSRERDLPDHRLVRAHAARRCWPRTSACPRAAFAHIPIDVDHERYIFPARCPGRWRPTQSTSPAGPTPRPYSHRLLAQEPIKAAGGQVRIVDSSNFPAATTIAAALVEVEPGGMRELHWHPNTDEWQYYIAGRGRMTVFASGGKARTFDYQAGDVGYVPFAMGHYVENTGDEPLRFLEMFRSAHFADISLNQWMALTPPGARAGPPQPGRADDGRPVQGQAASSRRAGTRSSESLPEWPAATIAVLTTVEQAPHAIPVSATFRADDHRILFALIRSHASLERLRKQEQVALTVMTEGDTAFTARGRARIVQEPMASAPEYAAVALDVEHVDDHRQPAFQVESGVERHWVDKEKQRAFDHVIGALRELAAASLTWSRRATPPRGTACSSL